MVDRFHRTYREKVLCAHLFESIEQLRRMTIRSIWNCKNERPHDLLLDLSPCALLLICGHLHFHYPHSPADFLTFR